MNSRKKIFLGIDSGATTCKVNGINADGIPLDDKLRQFPTPSEGGPGAVLDGWIHAAEAFLNDTAYEWAKVAGVGLAMPGPFLERGVLGNLPNYPDTFTGWRFLDELAEELRKVTGFGIPVTSANDGHLAGLSEAALIQRETEGSVFLLAPGSGLGSAFIDASGRMLEGDHISATFFCCMPIPYASLGLPKLPCKCGRDWGCIEGYTALSGLVGLIEFFLPNYPDHTFHSGVYSKREMAMVLRGLAQEDDELALEVFDCQAKAMGYAVAIASMAYDPSHVVIAGGLIDPESTTASFRERYMGNIKKSAARHLWIREEELQYHVARLGELSQSIGAALFASRQL